MQHHFVSKATSAALLLIFSVAVHAATSVLTRSYDNGRTGANLSETQLTPQLVASKGLRKIKSLKIPDDDRIEAQPLYVHGLVMSKDHQRHNVVFVASMGNHVFAFDADAPEGQDLLWQSTLLGAPFAPKATPANNPEHHKTSVDMWGINILWGIVSTPVIDLDTGQMYLVNWTQGNQKQVMQLHHLRLADGQEIGQGKVLTGVAKDANGAPLQDARGKAVRLNPDQKQRSALLLSPLRGAHKTLFIGITGGELPGDPHGWMVAVDVDSFTQTAAIPTTRRGFGGGIWQGSQGPASDDQGSVYVMTGNGGFNARRTDRNDPNPGTIGDFNGATDFAEAFIKFKYQRQGAGKGTLTLDDWFIPFQDSKRSANGEPDYQDQDLGAGGPVILPASHLVLGAGKDGILYILDRDNLGKKIGDLSVLKQAPIFITFNGLGLQPFPPNIDFQLGGAELGQGPPRKTHHLHGSPAYWVGPNGPMLFNWGENESLRAWMLDPNTGATTFRAKGAEIASRALATANTGLGGMTGGMISVSSNGKNGGIVWALAPIDQNANTQVVEGIARAYDASTLDPAPNGDGTQKLKLLWDSKKAGVTFNFSKFCPPMVADGRLYVATYDGRVDVYALNN